MSLRIVIAVSVGLMLAGGTLAQGPVQPDTAGVSDDQARQKAMQNAIPLTPEMILDLGRRSGTCCIGSGRPWRVCPYGARGELGRNESGGAAGRFRSDRG